MHFSIITVSYNAELTIGMTIDSILLQEYEDYEIIIKDGMSTDDTINRIPTSGKIHLIQLEDNGIYDAMNQAIRVSSGDYLFFLNCGDVFASKNVLKCVNDFLESNDKIDLLYGNYDSSGMICQQPEIITGFYLYRTPLCHQSMFFKRDLFLRLGTYDTTYDILADFDFTLRAWHYGAHFSHLSIVVCKYLGGGVSETPYGIKKKENERKRILHNSYPLSKRVLYNCVLALSLREFRIWLMNGHSPMWFRRVYRFISNKINQ